MLLRISPATCWHKHRCITPFQYHVCVDCCWDYLAQTCPLKHFTIHREEHKRSSRVLQVQIIRGGPLQVKESPGNIFLADKCVWSVLSMQMLQWWEHSKKKKRWFSTFSWGKILTGSNLTGCYYQPHKNLHHWTLVSTPLHRDAPTKWTGGIWDRSTCSNDLPAN